MQRIEYRDIIEFSKAIEELKSLRRLYWQGYEIENIYTYGPRGLITCTQTVFYFYEKYLKGIEVFDNYVIEINETISKISKDDLENGVFSKLPYKDEILEICNLIESIEQETHDLYSVVSIFSFYNSTFQTNTLLYRVNTMYPPEVWEFIPEQSKIDIIEGAKGLLVNIPTSSAFMFLRSLEGCIRGLCEKINPPPERDLTFGQGIDFIQNYFQGQTFDGRTEQFIQRQIQLLRYIKNEFRNPSAHPEKSFQQYEAEQLFQIVNVAINRLYDLSLLLCEEE